MNSKNPALCKFDIFKKEDGKNGDQICDHSWGCFDASSKSVYSSANVKSASYGDGDSGLSNLTEERTSERPNKLPFGWEERIAHSTKECYFYDTITRKVHFTLPPSHHREKDRNAWGVILGDYSDFNDQLRCRHILVKHSESDRCSSYRERMVRRTKQEALNKIMHARDLIQSGKFEFAELANMISDCCSARHGGDLGPLSLTQTPFVFERNILLLKDGELSEIFQTKAGYHILLRTPINYINYSTKNRRRRLKKIFIANEKAKSKAHLKKNQYFSNLTKQQKAFLCKKRQSPVFESMSSCSGRVFFKASSSTSVSEAPKESIKFARHQLNIRNLIVHSQVDETSRLGQYIKVIESKDIGKSVIKLQNVFIKNEKGKKTETEKQKNL